MWLTKGLLGSRWWVGPQMLYLSPVHLSWHCFYSLTEKQMDYYPLSGFGRISVVEVRERLSSCISVVLKGSWPPESKKKETEALKKVEIGNNRVLLYEQLFSQGKSPAGVAGVCGNPAATPGCFIWAFIHLPSLKKPQSFKWDMTLPLLSGYVPNEQSYFTQVAHSSGRVLIYT